MKLEKKHIQSYPIGGDNALKFKYDDSDIIRKIISVNGNGSIKGERVVPTKGSFAREYYISDIKPIFHPMSDLYKERNGKIDIVELNHIVTGADISDIKNCKIIKRDKEYEVLHSSYVSKDVWFSSMLEYRNNTFYYYWEGELEAYNPFELCGFLFTNHYDVYGLIDKGLAIDINMLKP